MLDKRTIHIADLQAETAEFSEGSRIARESNFHSVLAVPLKREDYVVGVIALRRQEVQLFTEKQVELAQNFAAQAVIAIENTRLLNELRQRTDDLSEALEQQTATAEVLKVISSSPGDLEPIFEATLCNAVHLCGAKFGALSLFEGDAFRSVALRGASPALAEYRQKNPLIRLTPGHNLERLVRTKNVVHIADLSADRAAAPIPFEVAGARALLNVPLLKGGELVGSILIYRQEVGSFSEKQIELVKNFAAQAVIAIEDTRLLNELRQRTDDLSQRTDDLSEALEQQTATSEVLKVISSSPGELEPVFQAMLENATHICEANYGMLFRIEDGAVHAAAMLGVPPEFAEFWRTGQKPSERTAMGRAAETMQTVHIVDVTTEPAYVEGEAVFVAAVDLGKFRTILVVPMIKDDKVIGLDCHLSPGGETIHRQADRVGFKFRCPGRHRHRKHASAQRTAAIVAAADGHRRRPEGD